MKLNEAIIRRIDEVCVEKGISICDATIKGGKSPSAIYESIVKMAKNRNFYLSVSTSILLSLYKKN